MRRIHLLFIIAVISASSLLCQAGVAVAPAFLNQILQSAQHDPSFNITYARNGCFVRAHWLAEKIHSIGYTPVKLFIHSQQLNQKINVQLSSAVSYQWVFHVAAGYKDAQGQIWVLDPVLSGGILSIEKWKDIIKSNNKNISLQIDLTSASVYQFDPLANAEWSQIASAGPFSADAMAFVNDAMADLFTWEQAERN